VTDRWNGPSLNPSPGRPPSRPTKTVEILVAHEMDRAWFHTYEAAARVGAHIDRRRSQHGRGRGTKNDQAPDRGSPPTVHGAILVGEAVPVNSVGWTQTAVTRRVAGQIPTTASANAFAQR
jgi:hypothetical protein